MIDRQCDMMSPKGIIYYNRMEFSKSDLQAINQLRFLLKVSSYIGHLKVAFTTSHRPCSQLLTIIDQRFSTYGIIVRKRITLSIYNTVWDISLHVIVVNNIPLLMSQPLLSACGHSGWERELLVLELDVTAPASLWFSVKKGAVCINVDNRKLKSCIFWYSL